MLDEIIGHEYTLIKSRLIKSGSRIIHKDDYLKGCDVVIHSRGELLGVLREPIKVFLSLICKPMYKGPVFLSLICKPMYKGPFSNCYSRRACYWEVILCGWVFAGVFTPTFFLYIVLS